MKFPRLLLVVGLSCILLAAIALARPQQAVAPAAAPDLLVLVHQEFQFGKESEREQLETSVARECDQIAVPNMWISMQSITGKPDALAFDPFDNFAQIDEAFAAWPQIYESHPDLGQLQQGIRALQTGERSIVATRRSDLSYQASLIDLSKARFMRVLEVRLHPGREGDFADAFKILRAAYAKIKADTPWVVYQVNVGMPSPTFLAFVPMRSLKQNDDLLAWRPLLREAEGDVAAKHMEDIAKEAYISSESNLYAIRPDLSHVSREFAEGDPQFWTFKPVASLPHGKTNPSPDTR